jgi:hypothetical protein
MEKEENQRANTSKDSHLSKSVICVYYFGRFQSKCRTSVFCASSIHRQPTQQSTISAAYPSGGFYYNRELPQNDKSSMRGEAAYIIRELTHPAAFNLRKYIRD